MATPEAEEGLALYAVDDAPLAESVAAARSLGVGRQESATGGIQLGPASNDRRRGVEEVGRRASGVIVFQSALDGPDVKDAPPRREAITLPQSTHTLLFTEDVLSLPFGFAFFILGISITCLVLALFDNLDHATPNNPLNIPANVSTSVRVAQFISLLVALLTEEEIPTALYLLRVIPKSSLRSKLGFSYGKFVASAISRLVVGYLFLIAVYLIVVQGEAVLEIFYDMLALNFVSMIDDIAFRLCTLDILGKRLRKATSATCFKTEFERKPYLFRKKMTLFTKIVYAVNFLALFAGLITVAVFQQQGRFQCASITVDFGDDVWEHAWVDIGGGNEENRLLVYSYFNGLYKMDGTHDGRPMYREMRKSGDGPFGEAVIGAIIMYCDEENAWIFTHEKIRKTTDLKESPCPWLLRSSTTDEYDLLDVPDDEWQIWIGTIQHDATLSITCNECQSDTDCNLNGVCLKDRTCQCTNPEYEGRHCELEKPCPFIISEISNETWIAAIDPNCTEYVREYSRPIYTRMARGNFTQGNLDVELDDRVSMIFTGSRWFGVQLHGGLNYTIKELDNIRSDFHAFWDKIYYNGTFAVSDPSKGSTPVGVDFYWVGEERGDQYGPFGVLYPTVEPRGRGNFRCSTVTKEGHAGICKDYWNLNRLRG